MTALTVGDLQQRVDRGMAWLDQHIPDWWHADRPSQGDKGGPIDLDALSMAHPCYCVLGHLLGNYYRAEIGLDEATACGFDTSARAERFGGPDEIRAAMAEEFQALAALWRRVIEARRAVPPDRP